MLKHSKIMLLFLLFTFLIANIQVASAETEWQWISSDSKYSKYFAPERVVVTVQKNNIATQIEAWTKTGYDYAGAAETIANYGIQAIIPDPARLSYSLARLHINPQERTVEYVQEIFYDVNGNVLWSKDTSTPIVKEINSRSFDEDFYCLIVDQVFNKHETQQSKASDRWLTLWKSEAADGSTVCWADTTTIRLRGNTATLWVWEERNTSGKVTEIKFRKKIYNLTNETSKIMTYNYWNESKGWIVETDGIDGRFYSIVPDSNEDAGIKELKKYIASHKDWVSRYNVE
ncbi:hypothetical protein SAMN05660742_10789 [Propionispira arboris]|uniref:Uncharacterized protein n=1 Tax=Propionispira arboris TaxID=84035 RepID=A0A1H6YML5_9FIRM|nr:hypothetical protein [Propionispira arboris]SEJ42521.1 hypothetical protein SAMN05660742_10789 [Propionispira arboris]